MLSKTLIEDKGFSQGKSNENNKVEKVGDNCKNCNTPVKAKSRKRKKFKPNQTYYYEYTLYCSRCKITYMTEEAKRVI